jgi:hypothetical protein
MRQCKSCLTSLFGATDQLIFTTRARREGTPFGWSVVNNTRIGSSVSRNSSNPAAHCTVIGSHLGLRISNFAPKNPSNVRISTKNILTFDGFASSLELQAGLSRIGVRTLFTPEDRLIPNSALRVVGLMIVCETRANSAGRKEIGSAATAAWLILCLIGRVRLSSSGTIVPGAGNPLLCAVAPRRLRQRHLRRP